MTAPGRANPNLGWKLHLNFDPDNEATRHRVAACAESLLRAGLIATYKLGNGGGRAGGENGKEATVYVGSFAATETVAARIERELGDLLEPPDAEMLHHDLPFSDRGLVWGRFTALHLPPGQFANYHQYGARGLPFLNEDMLRTNTQLAHLLDPDDRLTVDQAVVRARVTLEEDFHEYFTGPDRGVDRRIARAERVAQRGLAEEFGLTSAPPAVAVTPWWHDHVQARPASSGHDFGR